jgi:hypothetical protein
VLFEQNAEAPGSSNNFEGVLDGLQRRCSSLQFQCHHLYEHLRIGLAHALDSTGGKSSSEMLIIFDDAVVDKVNGPVLRGMRVGVDLRYAAVGGPSRVGDASSTFHRAGENQLQVRNLPHGLVGVDGRTVVNSNARGVVPSVFQSS